MPMNISFWNNLKHTVSHFARETTSKIVPTNQLLPTLTSLQDAAIVNGSELTIALTNALPSVKNKLLPKFGMAAASMNVVLAGDGLVVYQVQDKSDYALAHVVSVNEKKPLDSMNHSHVYLLCNPHFSQSGNRQLKELHTAETLRSVGDIIEHAIKDLETPTSRDCAAFDGLIDINDETLLISQDDVNALLSPQSNVADGIKHFINDDRIGSLGEASFPEVLIEYLQESSRPIGEQALILDYFIRGALDTEMASDANKAFKIGCVIKALDQTTIPLFKKAHHDLLIAGSAGIASGEMIAPAQALHLNPTDWQNTIQSFLNKTKDDKPLVQIQIGCIKHISAPTNGLQSIVQDIQNTKQANAASVTPEAARLNVESPAPAQEEQIIANVTGIPTKA